MVDVGKGLVLENIVQTFFAKSNSINHIDEHLVGVVIGGSIINHWRKAAKKLEFLQGDAKQ